MGQSFQLSLSESHSLKMSKLTLALAFLSVFIMLSVSPALSSPSSLLDALTSAKASKMNNIRSIKQDIKQKIAVKKVAIKNLKKQKKLVIKGLKLQKKHAVRSFVAAKLAKKANKKNNLNSKIQNIYQ